MLQIKAHLLFVSLFTLLLCHKGNALSNDSIIEFKNFKLSRIVLTGNAYASFSFNFEKNLIDTTGMTSTSMNAGLMPIVLWKITPKLFFEGEVELMLDHGMVETEIGYANLSYTIPELGAVQIGKFLSPFGIFSERYHPRWINCAPNEPLGFSHGAYSPQSDLGANLRGGSVHANYAFYISSSPTMESGEVISENAGKIDFDRGFEISNKVSLGGRVGVLPLKNSAIEIGLSYKWMQLELGANHHADSVSHLHTTIINQPEYINGNMYAIDLSIHKIMSKIKGQIELKAQANFTNTGNNTFIKLSDDGKTEVPYTFLNYSRIGFVMFSYKPILANNILKNSGIFVRGSFMNLPAGSLWYENTQELTVGLNYSFSWRNILKLAYQQTGSTTNKYRNNIVLQWAMGF